MTKPCKVILTFVLLISCLNVNSDTAGGKLRLEIYPDEPCSSPSGWCHEL